MSHYLHQQTRWRNTLQAPNIAGILLQTGEVLQFLMALRLELDRNSASGFRVLTLTKYLSADIWSIGGFAVSIAVRESQQSSLQDTMSLVYTLLLVRHTRQGYLTFLVRSAGSVM